MSEKVTPIRRSLQEAGASKRGGSILPDDCPVQPLGCSEDSAFFLNAIGQYVAVQKRQLNKLTIYGLFAPRTDYLLKHWPKTRDADEKPIDFKPDLVARDLINACAVEGAWDPSAGLNPDEAGRFIAGRMGVPQTLIPNRQALEEKDAAAGEQQLTEKLLASPAVAQMAGALANAAAAPPEAPQP